jgi:type VI secretion system protein ImpH
MATESRHEDPAVEKSASPQMLKALQEEPFDFDFFQAVRLLTYLLPDRKPVGRFSDPGKETVRFGAATELGFPPSQIASLELPEGKQPEMDLNFMGLTGPHGVLPLYYSSLLRERIRAGDGSLRAFLNIFNHRAVSLFYRAWEKHHFTVGYERKEEDPVSPHLMDIIGLGTPALASRQAISDEALLFRCGLLGMHARSASGLRALLIDYFDVPVEIEQFVGRWHAIDKDTQCCFGETGSDSERLGFGTVIGDEIWDQQSGLRVRLGPLALNQYIEFLPDGSAHQPLRAVIRFFVGNDLDCEVQLVLKKDEVPRCELGNESPAAPRLGWLTWAKSEPSLRDADESIIRI